MIQGVIFDMDGVISDTQTLHAKVESKILQRFNINLTPQEITRKYGGIRTKDFFKILLSKQNQPYDLNSLLKEKSKKMNTLASKSVKPIKGSIELIKLLHKNKIPIAVASASDHTYVITILDALKIKKYFPVIITGDMVKLGKPNPECFLLASTKICVPPQNCIVFEDAINGMKAAKRAKMRCIGLVSDLNATYPTKELVTSLKDISLKDILE